MTLVQKKIIVVLMIADILIKRQLLADACTQWMLIQKS